MSRWLFVGLALLSACKRTPAVAEDASPVAPTVDAAPPPAMMPTPPRPVVEFTPDASTSPADRDRALASLLAGASPARDLAEHATDVGTPFNNRLRRELTSVEVEDAPSSNVRADVQISGTAATVPVSDADRVIAGLRGRFRQCYQTGFDADPKMNGKVTLMTTVKPNGEVSGVEIKTNTGLSSAAADCVARVVKRATFSAPGANGSVLTTPITSVPVK